MIYTHIEIYLYQNISSRPSKIVKGSIKVKDWSDYNLCQVYVCNDTIMAVVIYATWEATISMYCVRQEEWMDKHLMC